MPFEFAPYLISTTFAQVLSRVSGVALFFPWLVARPGELPVRLGVAAAVSIGITGAVLPGMPAESVTGLALLCAGQLLAGAAIGFIASLPLAGLLASGELSRQFMGFPPGQQQGGIGLDSTSSLGNFTALLGLLIFLVVGGHHLLLRAIVRSFALVPVLPGGMKFAQVSGKVLLLAFQLALPVMLTVLLVTLALAVAARSAGQADAFLTGVPVRILAGLLALFVFLGPVSKAFAGYTQRLNHWLEMLLGS